MRKGIMLGFGVASVALALLSGCGNTGNKGAAKADDTKWKGAPYRISFDTPTAKPNPATINIPDVKFVANPEALETRAILVLRFDATGPTVKEPVTNHMIGNAVDIHGAQGELPADYMARASKGMEDYLADHCLTGKVKLSVALARSSLAPGASDADLDAKLLSSWLPTEVTYKNPHPKCR